MRTEKKGNAQRGQENVMILAREEVYISTCIVISISMHVFVAYTLRYLILYSFFLVCKFLKDTPTTHGKNKYSFRKKTPADYS